MHALRIEKLIDFLSKEPNDPFLKYAIATEYLAQNNTTEALQYFEDLVINHADYVGTYYHLGKLYWSLEEREKSLHTLEKGIEVAKNKKDQHALSELQNLYNDFSFDD